MIQVRHNKRMGTKGLSFYHPPPAVRPRLDAGSDEVKPAPCFIMTMVLERVAGFHIF